MQTVTYRPLRAGDVKALAQIIGAVWYADEPTGLQERFGAVYLAQCAQRMTYAQVAEVDGVAVGVVVARAGEPEEEVRRTWRRAEDEALDALEKAYPGAAEEVVSGLQTESEIDARLAQESGCDLIHEIVLFAVAASTRGLGVGKELIGRAEDYLARQGAESFYLFTDTDCTWQFYEHRGMERRATWRRAADDERPLSDEMYVYAGVPAAQER